MHYEVTSALKPGQQLTARQRTSSYFTDAPRVGTHTIRRGQVLRLSSEQFKASKGDLKKLLLGHSIEIFQVDDSGKVPVALLDGDLVCCAVQPKDPVLTAPKTTETSDAQTTPPVVEAQVVDSTPAVEPAPESSVPPATVEPVKDNTPQYAPPPAPPMPEKTYSTKKSKK